jgi:hypothetical protein
MMMVIKIIIIIRRIRRRRRRGKLSFRSENVKYVHLQRIDTTNIIIMPNMRERKHIN